jgi:large subunit ribosomal protein L10e
MYAEGKKMRARNYREVKGQPYTRKKYVKGFPPPKITRFTMGDTKSEFEYELRLIALKEVQVRHSALEAARVTTNRGLMKRLSENYCLRIIPYPHIILRENKMIFGAHADRLQDGMRKSFGKPIGTAARVEKDQPVIQVNVNKDGVETAKNALKRASAKLPTPCRIIIEKAESLEEVNQS